MTKEEKKKFDEKEWSLVKVSIPVYVSLNNTSFKEAKRIAGEIIKKLVIENKREKVDKIVGNQAWELHYEKNNARVIPQKFVEFK